MKEFKNKFPYWLENKLIEECEISKEHFHKVDVNKYKNIYYKITEKFVDKTKTWKNGLHWANTNGYSPKSMENLLGCYYVDYSKWFYQLPQIIPNDDMVYFLIDFGGDWYTGEKFLIFESCIPELIKVLALLNQTAFFDMGHSDYYIVSKKYKWIIGFNHHDVVSFVGEGLSMDCFTDTKI